MKVVHLALAAAMIGAASATSCTTYLSGTAIGGAETCSGGSGMCLSAVITSDGSEVSTSGCDDDDNCGNAGVSAGQCKSATASGITAAYYCSTSTPSGGVKPSSVTCTDASTGSSPTPPSGPTVLTQRVSVTGSDDASGYTGSAKSVIETGYICGILQVTCTPSYDYSAVVASITSSASRRDFSIDFTTTFQSSVSNSQSQQYERNADAMTGTTFATAVNQAYGSTWVDGEDVTVHLSSRTCGGTVCSYTIWSSADAKNAATLIIIIVVVVFVVVVVCPICIIILCCGGTAALCAMCCCKKEEQQTVVQVNMHHGAPPQGGAAVPAPGVLPGAPPGGVYEKNGQWMDQNGNPINTA